MPVYTIGHEQSYDKGLRDHGAEFKKCGKTDSLHGRGQPYAGGASFRTPQEARKYLNGRHGDYAVYELDANWFGDTEPGAQGEPFHRLLKDARIVRKVAV